MTELAGQEDSRELLVSTLLPLGCPENAKNEGFIKLKLVIRNWQSERLDCSLFSKG